ncbi:protein FAM169B-like isoform X2 [Tiliqua scincoides]|uniref:protein FAM169B-like isoform X2 n=1 Tax=Tiliqua scincoides TaxID=71010 RepID=UPI0034621542
MAAARGRPAGDLYPMDIKDIKLEALEAESRAYHAKVLKQPSSAAEFFSVPGREKVKLEASLMRFLPLYREESKCALLVLIDSQDKNTVLAIYLHSSWWLIEDIVKTTDPSREGLMQTSAERILLFVLNCIIFGMLERGSTCDVLFMPHSEKECAKIFWRSGEAAAFYTTKAKGTMVRDMIARKELSLPGSLCDSHTSLCYLLPVLDTMFVRRKFRRRGLGLEMLHDFCEVFTAEDALGISCPVSVGMYQVCQRFLEIHPEEQSRLWEVESPGDWSQRINIWLKIQLEQNFPKQMDVSCNMERFPDDEPGPSAKGWTNEKGEHVPQLGTSTCEEKLHKSDQEKASSLQPHGGEHAIQQDTDVQQRRESKKRASRGRPAEDRAPKQCRAMP